MTIQNPDGEPIRSLADWQALHRPKHWRAGRSAHAVADFMLNRDGARVLSRRVSAVLGERAEFREITPELEIRFDRHGKGRFHDLGIRGATESGATLFVGVEAKVDEMFGRYVSEEWRNATRTRQSGQRTRRPDRISELCDRFQDGPGISEYDEVRYQLMHAAAGTVEAGADVSVLYIAVFATDDYDPAKGEANRQDFRTFIARAGGTPTPNQRNAAESHNLNLSGKRLTTIYETFDFHANQPT